MKKLSLLFPLLVIGLFACHQEKPPVFNVLKSADYKKAEAFLDHRNDSAFYYFNKVAVSSKDSLQTAMAYTNMSIIQSDAGDYFGAQESLLSSMKYLDTANEKDHRCLSSIYNELGMTSFRLRNYDVAITYFDMAVHFSTIKKNQLIFLNNKALSYQEKGDYPRALRLYCEIITQTTQPGTYARILTNFATTKWLQNPHYDAAPELIKALAIRRKEKDEWGQNSSYAHLAGFYTRSHPDSAWYYANEMYMVARRLKSPDDELIALKKLAELGQQKGRAYFSLYIHLNDSLQNARNAAKNQFALIRYDAERSKANNLRLQKDNAEKKYQIIKQQAELWGACLVLLSGGVTGFFWYRRRKQRLELEKQQAILEHEFHTAKKVHDGVANGLYRLINEVENAAVIEKDPLLEKLDVLYERSRDISYEKRNVSTQNFNERISGLLTAFASPAIKVAVRISDEAVWDKVSVPVRHELEHILQELMVNMKKHSKADSVAVRIEVENQSFHMYYTDNGIGLPAEGQYGNGLKNMVSRIKAIRGTLIFDTESTMGTKIHITFPIV